VKDGTRDRVSLTCVVLCHPDHLLHLNIYYTSSPVVNPLFFYMFKNVGKEKKDPGFLNPGPGDRERGAVDRGDARPVYFPVEVMPCVVYIKKLLKESPPS